MKKLLVFVSVICLLACGNGLTASANEVITFEEYNNEESMVYYPLIQI